MCGLVELGFGWRRVRKVGNEGSRTLRITRVVYLSNVMVCTEGMGDNRGIEPLCARVFAVRDVFRLKISLVVGGLEVLTSLLGQAEQCDGNQNQRESVGTDNSTNLSWQIGLVSEGTG